MKTPRGIIRRLLTFPWRIREFDELQTRITCLGGGFIPRNMLTKSTCFRLSADDSCCLPLSLLNLPSSFSGIQMSSRIASRTRSAWHRRASGDSRRRCAVPLCPRSIYLHFFSRRALVCDRFRTWREVGVAALGNRRGGRPAS